MGHKINYNVTTFAQVIQVKAAPWDDINFSFYFCNEVVYSPDLFFQSFQIF